jgi:DNA polymerase/3'-5' exonuclease PolX
MMDLHQATEIAERLRTALAPHCEQGRCEIAGSIRRRRPKVGDIEIVCIPRLAPARLDLFNSELQPVRGFVDLVNTWPAVKGSPLGKYTQRILPEGIKLDLFIACPENWGLILATRTGSADYSHRVLAAGWVRAGYHSHGGFLILGMHKIPVREERQLFEAAGVPWVEPEDREVQT